MRVYDKNNKLVFEENHNIFLPPSKGFGYWLSEAYDKVDTKLIENYLDDLVNFVLGKLDKKAFYQKSEDLRIGFELVKESSKDNPKFDPSTNNGMTIIPIKKSQLKAIIEDETFKERYIRFLKNTIAHENTHEQQFDRYEGYCKDYVAPEGENPFDLISEKDKQYFSQTIEADAYGRQVGESLLQSYKGLSCENIFKKVINNQIPKDVEDIIKVYKSREISKKAFKHFWTTLYDYLKGNEKDLEESLKISLEKSLGYVK